MTALSDNVKVARAALENQFTGPALAKPLFRKKNIFAFNIYLTALSDWDYTVPTLFPDAFVCMDLRIGFVFKTAG